jgi:hypothetical protein
MESWKAEMTIGAANSLSRIVYLNGAEPLGQQTIKAGKQTLLKVVK